MAHGPDALPLDLGDDHMAVYICKKSLSVRLRFVHFTICKLCLNKVLLRRKEWLVQSW